MSNIDDKSTWQLNQRLDFYISLMKLKGTRKIYIFKLQRAVLASFFHNRLYENYNISANKKYVSYTFLPVRAPLNSYFYTLYVMLKFIIVRFL